MFIELLGLRPISFLDSKDRYSLVTRENKFGTNKVNKLKIPKDILKAFDNCQFDFEFILFKSDKV